MFIKLSLFSLFFVFLFNSFSFASNTATGTNALASLTTGYNNTANGYQSLYSNTEGYRNTAVGSQSLYSNTSGSSNTAIGYQAGYENKSGEYMIQNSRLVFTTATGRIKKQQQDFKPKGEGTILIRHDGKGRRGRGVTVLSGFAISRDQLKKTCQNFKERMLFWGNSARRHH